MNFSSRISVRCQTILKLQASKFHSRRACITSSNFINNTHIRGFSKDTPDPRKMVDPKRVLSYEDVLKVISQPEKVLIDVRNPDEVKSTGKIPSSINIPLGNVQNALTSMSNDEFKRQYQRNKPSSNDEIIFYCHSGKRSSEALNKALQLGYSNSKTYLGSWNEWSSKTK